MNTFRKTAVAALALATVSASMMTTTTSAQAGNKFLKGVVAGVVGAAIVGSIAHANSHRHGGYSNCWYETEKRWNAYDEPYWVKVKYCN